MIYSIFDPDSSLWMHYKSDYLPEVESLENRKGYLPLPLSSIRVKIPQLSELIGSFPLPKGIVVTEKKPFVETTPKIPLQVWVFAAKWLWDEIRR